MNKRAGIGMRVFTVLIAAAVISTLIFVFYAYYGVSEKAIEFKLTEKTADFKQNHALISLLNTPVNNEINIADLIVIGRTDEAKAQIKSVLDEIYGPELEYTLAVDGDVLLETGHTPEMPVTQEVVLPKTDHKISRVIFEFGK